MESGFLHIGAIISKYLVALQAIYSTVHGYVECSFSSIQPFSSCSAAAETFLLPNLDMRMNNCPLTWCNFERKEIFWNFSNCYLGEVYITSAWPDFELEKLVSRGCEGTSTDALHLYVAEALEFLEFLEVDFSNISQQMAAVIC